MFQKKPTTYDQGMRFFHWGMAFIILGLLVVGFIMGDLPPSAGKKALYQLHKAFGVLILVLFPLRLVWRLFKGAPGFPKGFPRWDLFLASISVFLMYVFMLGMPLSGFLMSTFGGHPIEFFGLATIPAFADAHPLGKIGYKFHGILAYPFVALIILHIGAALYHHFIRKDIILKRMLHGKI